MLFKKKVEPLKCFFDENRKLNYLRQADRNIQTVEIDKIKGSVGRCLDFDTQFHSKSGARESTRFKRIKQSMVKGEYYPVVELYKMADEYYILDGHHRISAAKEIGWIFIDAHVVEHLPSKTKTTKIRDEFEKKTGLTGIQLTDPNDYLKLLSQIETYREKSARDSGGPVSVQEAAQHWFENVYGKVRVNLEALEPDDQFAGKTLDDILVHLCEQMQLRLIKEDRYDESLEKAWETLHLLCKTPSSTTPNHTLKEKIKKLFSPCFYTGKCES